MISLLKIRLEVLHNTHSLNAFIVMRFPTENFGNDKVNRFLSMIT